MAQLRAETQTANRSHGIQSHGNTVCVTFRQALKTIKSIKDTVKNNYDSTELLCHIRLDFMEPSFCDVEWYGCNII